ncbi:hypothetical protein [Legionella erythra]|nr:hypothetical protein [Legionella erythra]
MTNSLYRDLNQQLPGSWRIRFQNFLSFLPGVKPVDERVVILRKKLKADDFQYVDYYHCHSDYFNQRYKGKICHQSSEETAYLVDAYPPPPLTSPALTRLGPPEPAAPTPLNNRNKPAEFIQAPRAPHWIEQEAEASQTILPSQSLAC